MSTDKKSKYYYLPYMASLGIYNAHWKSRLKNEIKEELRQELLLEIREILKHGEIHADWEHIKIDENYCKK